MNVNRTIEEVIELTRPRWRDLPQREGISIQIQHELESNLPPLLSDPAELREALINLVFNAVDALPQGGTITFITQISAAPPRARPETPSDVQVEVRDNGVGMDERTRARCLEPFFSTKAKRGGTGLGLAMVYGMMQRHDGKLEIDSVPGRGTSVRLTFPIRQKTAPPPPPPQGERRPDAPLRILCIDDEPQMRRVLVDCLKPFNHQVTVTATGREGIEAFRKARLDNQPYHVVVTDLGMPEMDGAQVAKIIKGESPTTPVVMMTGWGTMMKEEGDTDPQVDVLLGKPPHMNELHRLLLDVVSRAPR